ncbi:MAG TPA: hypothetical protein PKZ22_03830 [Accumulibacter sp.]|jgi:hypothetical protein|nr:hypothetical protein [Accumulibacter sp.]
MSKRRDHQRPEQRSRVAEMAARLLAEDGIGDLTLAKRKAARHLGLSERARLPDDGEVENELRIYHRLFQDEEQRARNRQLLRIAAELMARLQDFSPYLTGAVLEGTAGRHAEIDIQLFADSAKEVEIFLLNERIAYQHSVPRTERAEAVLTLIGGEAIANLVVYPRDQERVSFKTRDGRVRPRARLEVVGELLAADEPPA